MKKSISSQFLNLSSTTVGTSSSASNLLKLAQEDVKAATKIPDVPFTTETVKICNIDCCLYSYDPESTYCRTPPKALVVYLHGFNAHGAFPTTKLVAELMLKNGYAFMAPDLPGHGLTSGPRGFIESGELMIEFSARIIEHAYRKYLQNVCYQKMKNLTAQNPGLKLFVIGSSMGGNLALHCALRSSSDIAGVILLAPMLKHALVSPASRMLIKLGTKTIPKAKVIPILKNKHYRCPHIHREVERDTLKPHSFGDFARIQSLASLVDLTDSLESQMKNILCPCLIMVGEEDAIVDNDGAVDLAIRAPSRDMTLKRYPALHALMGEPSPLLEVMQEDIIKWMGLRSETIPDLRSSM